MKALCAYTVSVVCTACNNFFILLYECYTLHVNLKHTCPRTRTHRAIQPVLPETCKLLGGLVGLALGFRRLALAAPD